MTLVALPVMVKGTLGWLLPRQAVQWIARLAPRLACAAIMVLSLSRVAALLLNYGAPLQVYRQLPEVGPNCTCGAVGTNNGVSQSHLCIATPSTTGLMWIQAASSFSRLHKPCAHSMQSSEGLVAYAGSCPTARDKHELCLRGG